MRHALCPYIPHILHLKLPHMYYRYWCNDSQIVTQIVVNRTIYGEFDSDFCSQYEINISELFCALEIVKTQCFPTIVGDMLVTWTPGKQMGGIMIQVH